LEIPKVISHHMGILPALVLSCMTLVWGLESRVRGGNRQDFSNSCRCGAGLNFGVRGESGEKFQPAQGTLTAVEPEAAALFMKSRNRMNCWQLSAIHRKNNTKENIIGNY